MNTDTYTRTYDNRSDAYTVLGRLLDLNERAEKKGLDGTVTVTTKTTEVTRTNEAGDQEPGVEVELTITTTGGFTLDDARKATAAPVPVTDERITIEGEVVTAKWVDDFGAAYKLRVVTPEGWAAWGTCPKAITPTETYDEDLNEWVPIGVKVGDKVRFVARVERSRDDELFGFWYRPSKAEIVETA